MKTLLMRIHRFFQRVEIPKCTCGSTRPSIIFDAQGWQRWCVDCGHRRP